MTDKARLLVATLRSFSEYCQERSAVYRERMNFLDWSGGDYSGRESAYRIVSEHIKELLEKYA